MFHALSSFDIKKKWAIKSIMPFENIIYKNKICDECI